MYRLIIIHRDDDKIHNPALPEVSRLLSKEGTGSNLWINGLELPRTVFYCLQVYNNI
jgi:hypothetical protein